MPKMDANKSYSPQSQARKASKSSAYDMTRIRPAKNPSTGKLGGLGAKVKGGNMNTGGKRRPGHM